MTTYHPAYLKLLESGELENRVNDAKLHLDVCDVCPLLCGVNRTAGELGICETGEKVQVSSHGKVGAVRWRSQQLNLDCG